MGLSLASPLKVRQAMTLSETCGSWRSSSSRSQEGHVHAFVLLALIVGEHGFHVPLVVDQQAEAFGLELDVAGQLAADFREHVLPDLAELAEVAGRCRRSRRGHRSSGWSP